MLAHSLGRFPGEELVRNFTVTFSKHIYVTIDIVYKIKKNISK